MRLIKSLLTVIIVTMVLASCHLKKFIMPTWDVNVNIPLLNEKYFVSDLIDSVNFFYSDDNRIVFRTSGTLETEPIGEIAIPMDVDTGNLPLQAGEVLQDFFPLSNLQTGSEVAYGLISDGGLRVTFSGMSNTVSQVTLTLLNVLNEAGQPLSIDYDGNEGGFLLPLDGYHVGTEGSDTIINNVDFTVTIVTTAPEGSNVGYLRLGMVDDIKFSKFRGRIPSLSIAVEDNQSHIDIDYPWGIENAIQLQDAEINLHIVCPLAYPCIVNGDFYAINFTTGESDTISLLDENGNPYTINPRVGDTPGITDIRFTNNVDDLLRIMPEYIELRNAHYQIVNSEGVIGELNSTDMITGEYIADSPFTFVLHDAMITPRDSIKIEISKDNRDTIKKNILNAQMELRILNQLPIGAEIKMYFSTNPTIIPDDTTTWAFCRTADLVAGSEPNIEQSVPIDLTHDELLLFTNPVVYMKQTFRFHASDGPVTITASPADYIQIRSKINVEAHVEE